MDLKPPVDSNIRFMRDSINTELSIPYGNGGRGLSKFFIAIFLLIWLCGWLLGFSFVFLRIIEGKGSFFEIFWLTGWSVGGVFAAFFLYRILKPPVNQTITLKRNSIFFDSGIPPFNMANSAMGYGKRDGLKLLFPKRIRTEIVKEDLKNLKLKVSAGKLRLFTELSGERIEFATGLSNSEKEWLFKIITEKYL